MKHHFAIVVVLMACLVCASRVHALRITVPGPGGRVNLPYMQPDGSGSTWMIYQTGYLQQQGNNPVYSQGAMLTINGQQPQARGNTAKIDEKTGELLLEDMNCNNLLVTRRILFNKEDGSVRFIDILKNPQAQDVQVNLMLQSSLNFGINLAQMYADPKKKDQNIGWVAQTGNGRCAVELFAGKGSKMSPNINWQQGNNEVNAQAQVTVPANKSVAVVHFHVVTGTADQGNAWINNLKESKVMASIPKEIRKLILNFGSPNSFIGDLEILRGDLLDVVELRGGDQLKGTLKDASFKLMTNFGEVDLPADKITGMLNVGQYRPRQLMVTSDGQIFGGALAKNTINLELSSGQLTQIPITQIARLGVRKRANESEEPTFTGAYLQLRSGDRVSVEAPDKLIELVTRYGKLSLTPASIAAIQFQVEEHGVHDIYLTDGSKFAGLVPAESFQLTLVTGGKVVSFPTSTLFRLQLVSTIDDRDASSATLKLANGDLLVGSLDGAMKLDTAFDSIAVNGPEIRALTHPKESAADVQVTLWDQTTLTGQLQTPAVKCKLVSGLEITVPASLIDVYSQPFPRPAGAMVERIKTIVKDLSADDWKQRDHAEGQLSQMGTAVIGVLKELRGSQPPEAQQRIDTILKQLQKGGGPTGAAKPAAPGFQPVPMQGE